MVKKAKVKKRSSKKYRPISTVEFLKKSLQNVGSDKSWRVYDDEFAKDGTKLASYTPSPILTLCGQLEDAILLLETRISNSIAKINSLM